ncbi:MAG: SPOR domain-containing protein [Nevskia sp.]|nr:SPOR domain-containing protein [Nevskia sp.]
MNEVFRRRLIGLAVLLTLAFLLSLLLPGAPTRDEVEPSTSVSLSGESLQVTEADAVPPPDDYTSPQPPPDSQADAAASGAPSSADDVAISDMSSTEADASGSADKPAPAVSKPAPAAKPPASVATPKPKPATVLASPTKPVPADKPAAGWYVQIGSFAEAGSATTIVSLIGKQGHRGQISKITGANGKTLHRIRAGPYPTEAAARSAQVWLATQGYRQTRVVSEASR